jgi:hypothetical protein
MLNTSYAPNPQAPDLVPDADVEILSPEDWSRAVAEYCAFRRQIPAEDRDTTRRRHAICIAFQSGAIGAVEAMHMLADGHLYGDPDYFLAAYAAGVRALSEGAA